MDNVLIEEFHSIKQIHGAVALTNPAESAVRVHSHDMKRPAIFGLSGLLHGTDGRSVEQEVRPTCRGDLQTGDVRDVLSVFITLAYGYNNIDGRLSPSVWDAVLTVHSRYE